VLDIGGDVGALVIMAPAELAGREIEARPVRGSNAAQHATVLGRRAGDATVYGVVVSGLAAGEYDLALLPGGPVRDRVTIVGGEVTESRWPG
jgi:hypothetical protein